MTAPMCRVTACRRGEASIYKTRAGWAQRTRWLLTLECGHNAEKLGPKGRKPATKPVRVRCEQCAEEEK